MSRINLCPRRPEKPNRILLALRADRTQQCLVPSLEVKLRFPLDVQDQIIIHSSDTMTIKEDNWCDEGKHVGVPTHFTNPDGTPVIHCTICGKQLQSSQKGENGINKERLLAMRLDMIGTTLDGPDFKDEPIEQGVLEGLLFNIGKLLLEHLEEHRSSETTTMEEVE